MFIKLILIFYILFNFALNKVTIPLNLFYGPMAREYIVEMGRILEFI